MFNPQEKEWMQATLCLAGEAARQRPSALRLGGRWGGLCLEQVVKSSADLLWSKSLTRNKRRARKSLRPELGSPGQSYIGIRELWNVKVRCRG